jgi:hypothetical protein
MFMEKVYCRLAKPADGLAQSAANRVIFKRLNIDIELPETIPQGLKPAHFVGFIGTAEAVP